MKVSLVMLTFDRGEAVERCWNHNMANKGADFDELILVDNGSTDSHLHEFLLSLPADIRVLNKANTGVARGYNLCMGLATKELVCITGCDRLFPDDWLKVWIEYFEKIPETGVASMWSVTHDKCRERYRQTNGREEEVNGLKIVRGMPFGARMFRRELLGDAGYFPETFGLYGWDDVAYAETFMKVCDHRGLLYYAIPHMVPMHTGWEDPKDYKDFKNSEVKDPAKDREMTRLRNLGFPPYKAFL